MVVVDRLWLREVGLMVSLREVGLTQKLVIMTGLMVRLMTVVAKITNDSDRVNAKISGKIDDSDRVNAKISGKINDRVNVR